MLNKLTVKQQKAFDSHAWLSFFLSDEQKQAVTTATGVTLPDDAHLTLCYLGLTSEVLSESNPNMMALRIEQLKNHIGEWARYQSPISGAINGTGVFYNEMITNTFLYDAATLEHFRYDLTQMLHWNDYRKSYTHGYIPHITISIDQPFLNTFTELHVPLVFDRMSLSIGGETFSIDLPTMEMEVGKAGSRNNKRDKGDIQKAHDTMCRLGASCKAEFMPAEKAVVPEQVDNQEITDIPSTTTPNNLLSIPPMHNALKAISRDDDTLIVENCIILFGSPEQRDLEGLASNRVNEDGSKGEFFTAATQVESSFTKSVGRLPVDWEHGIRPDDGAGRNDVLGWVDISKATPTEQGLKVQMILDRHNEFVKMLDDYGLIDAGLVSTSSEPVQEGVVKADNGEIKEWPLFRNALTVTPMEPRMLSENQLVALKAYGLWGDDKNNAAESKAADNKNEKTILALKLKFQAQAI